MSEHKNHARKAILFALFALPSNALLRFSLTHTLV